MGEQVDARLRKGDDVCVSRLQSPSRTRSFEHRGTEWYQPITEGRTVKINAGFTSGQRVSKSSEFY